MEGKSVSGELYRQYEFRCPVSGNTSTYTILDPKVVYIGKTTHRVLDNDGIVHCVPAVGQLNCVLRWKPRDVANPVQF